MSERPLAIDEAWMKVVLHFQKRAIEIEASMKEEIELLREANTRVVLENGKLLDRLASLTHTDRVSE
jgi:regulator of replication initiation timing